MFASPIVDLEESPATGLSSWDLGEPVPNHLYDRMIQHAAFPAAVRALADGMLVLSARDKKIDGIFKDAGRYVAAMCAASMPNGVTLAGLKTLCARFGLLSPGRARALLLYLRYLTYVSLWSERSREGPARYQISPGFADAWRTHLVVALKAASLIEPACAVVADRLDDPEFFGRFCRIQLEGMAAGALHWDSNMAFIRVFLNRHAGTQIAWTLLVQEGDGPFPFAGPLHGSKLALARRFNVSLMHVKRVFAAAEREGILTEDDQHQLFLTEAGAEQIRFLYAAQLIRLIMTAKQVFDHQGDPNIEGLDPAFPLNDGALGPIAGTTRAALPQYEIKSSKTDPIAVHKGSALAQLTD